MYSIGKHVSKLSGYSPALPTPFDKTGALDTMALKHLCHRQVQEGANALVMCGAIGESPTLSPAEHDAIVRIAVDVAQGRIPVIAATDSNSTTQAIELTKRAEAAGADAILSVVPYYNKPTQAGMYAHFCAVSESTSLPLILHDVPSRTVCGLADDTVARLAELPNCIGIQDATGDVSRPLRLRSLIKRRFRLLSGDDTTAFAFLVQGGDGCISVTSNVAPYLCRDMYLALKHGQLARAQQLASSVAKLTAMLSKDGDPAAIKFALGLFGVIAPNVRLPMVEVNDQARAEISAMVAELCSTRAGYMIGR